MLVLCSRRTKEAVILAIVVGFFLFIVLVFVFFVYVGFVHQYYVRRFVQENSFCVAFRSIAVLDSATEEKELVACPVQPEVLLSTRSYTIY